MKNDKIKKLEERRDNQQIRGININDELHGGQIFRINLIIFAIIRFIINIGYLSELEIMGRALHLPNPRDSGYKLNADMDLSRVRETSVPNPERGMKYANSQQNLISCF